jgi:hypothetical protein
MTSTRVPLQNFQRHARNADLLTLESADLGAWLLVGGT